MYTITTHKTIYKYCKKWSVWSFNSDFICIERNLNGSNKILILPIKDIESIFEE